MASQASTRPPDPQVFLTGHNSEGKAVIHSRGTNEFGRFDNDQLFMKVAYTNNSPVDMNNDVDVADHKKVLAGTLGLVRKDGTVLRFVDFAPGYTSMMHRTQSLDFGVVLKGECESVLDSGEVELLRQGDVMVQRATMHAWRNPSKTDWCRMLFVLQDSKPLFVGGQRFGEDLTDGAGTVPPSGNDM